MGRSVSYPHNTIEKVYYDTSSIEDECDWDEFVDNLKYNLQAQFKSLEDCDEWLGREDHAFLENRFVYVGISEYCGLSCVWIALKDNLDAYYNDHDLNGLANAWVNKISKKFYKDYGDLYKCGTFSNGCSVYETKKRCY
jgi:hypothetical protein